MKHIFRQDEFLYLWSMGRKLRVTAIFTDDDEANRHMSKSDDAVIACFEPFILLADKNDRGGKP